MKGAFGRSTVVLLVETCYNTAQRRRHGGEPPGRATALGLLGFPAEELERRRHNIIKREYLTILGTQRDDTVDRSSRGCPPRVWWFLLAPQTHSTENTTITASHRQHSMVCCHNGATWWHTAHVVAWHPPEWWWCGGAQCSAATSLSQQQQQQARRRRHGTAQRTHTHMHTGTAQDRAQHRANNAEEWGTRHTQHRGHNTAAPISYDRISVWGPSHNGYAHIVATAQHNSTQHSMPSIARAVAPSHRRHRMSPRRPLWCAGLAVCLSLPHIHDTIPHRKRRGRSAVVTVALLWGDTARAHSKKRQHQAVVIWDGTERLSLSLSAGR